MEKVFITAVILVCLVCLLGMTACEKEEPHVCGNVCPVCGKCTDINCADPVCAEKCNGHQPAVVGVTSVAISGEDDIEMAFDETKTFTATVLPENANDKTVVWSVISTNLETTDYSFANGTLTVKQIAGYVVIKAQSGEYSDIVTVVINHGLSEPEVNLFKATFLASDGETIVDIRLVEEGDTLTVPDYMVSSSTVEWLDAEGNTVDLTAYVPTADVTFTAKVTQQEAEYSVSYWYTDAEGNLVQQGETYTLPLDGSQSVPSQDVAEIKAAVETVTGKTVVNWKQEVVGYEIKLIAEFAIVPQIGE